MHPFRVPANLCRTLLRGAVTAWRSVVYGLAAAIWFLGHFRVELWRVEGEEQNSHLPLSILCAVNDEDHERNYLLQLIFGDSYCQKPSVDFGCGISERQSRRQAIAPLSSSACATYIFWSRAWAIGF